MLAWHSIHHQIAQYVEVSLEHRAELHERLGEYLRLAQEELADDWRTWKERVQRSARKHLIPHFDESPLKVYEVSPLQTPPLVLSSDGSQLIPNRHEAVPFGLIHISRVQLDYLHYQDEQIIDAQATVFSIEDVMQSAAPDQHLSFDEFITDRRTIAEMQQLVQLANSNQAHIQSHQQPALLLLDGSLILWQLAGRSDKAYKNRITRDYVYGLADIQKTGIPIAGYISQSGSREVVQLLQWIEEETGKRPKNAEPTPAEKSLTDVMLFRQILSPGQRSVVFQSQSQILDDYKKINPANTVCYFFLHVDSEVVKVEIPLWTADRFIWVDQTAAICLQQVELGQGYPISISLAHESAVVRSADRQSFFALVEQELIRHGVYPSPSAKLTSKHAPVF